MKGIPRSRCDSDFAQVEEADCYYTIPVPIVLPQYPPVAPSRLCRTACFLCVQDSCLHLLAPKRGRISS